MLILLCSQTVFLHRCLCCLTLECIFYVVCVCSILFCLFALILHATKLSYSPPLCPLAGVTRASCPAKNFTLADTLDASGDSFPHGFAAIETVTAIPIHFASGAAEIYSTCIWRSGVRDKPLRQADSLGRNVCYCV